MDEVSYKCYITAPILFILSTKQILNLKLLRTANLWKSNTGFLKQYTVEPLNSPAVSYFFDDFKDALHQHRNIFKSHSTTTTKQQKSLKRTIFSLSFAALTESAYHLNTVSHFIRSPKSSEYIALFLEPLDWKIAFLFALKDRKGWLFFDS